MIMGEQMGGVVKNQAAMYYLKYYLNRPDVIPIFLLAGISGALLAQPLVLKASRRARQSSLMIGGYLMAAASIALVWISDQSLWLLMTVNVMFGLFMAFPANLVYVYAADLADELSYAGNGSFSGIVNSLLGVAGKFGYAAAGSAVALMLHMTSYAPNVPQSPPAIWGIKMCFISLPAIIMILSAVFASASFRGGRAPDIHADVREDASAPYV
jgi:Na+/melibiose symporter-like transporter